MYYSLLPIFFLIFEILADYDHPYFYLKSFDFMSFYLLILIY